MVARCEAEIHAHLDGKCLGVINRCIKEAGHHMRGWHQTPDGSVRWDYDHRLDPIHDEKEDYSEHPEPAITAPDATAQVGDLVLFRWLDGTYTARLITRPFPGRKYVTVRTRKNDFKVPLEEVWPLESLIAPPWDPEYVYPN